MDDEDAEFCGFGETRALGGVLDEFELLSDVLDEFLEGVSGDFGGVSARD